MKHNISLFCIKAFCIYKKVISQSGISWNLLKKSCTCVFCISVNSDGKKILQQFYSTSFEEKDYNQCIVNEKIKSARLRIQLFDLLIFCWNTCNQKRPPTFCPNHWNQQSHFHGHLDYSILHVKHKNQVYVFLIHNLNSLMNSKLYSYMYVASE